MGLINRLRAIATADGLQIAKNIVSQTPKWVTDVWYSGYDCADHRTSGVGYTTNRLYFVPMFVPGPNNGITAIGQEVVSAPTVAAEHMRLGVYADRDGRPGTLLCDSGIIEIGLLFTGTKQVASTAFVTGNGYEVRGGGRFWLAFVTDNAGTVDSTFRAVTNTQARAYNVGVTALADPGTAPDSATGVYIAHTSTGAGPDALPADAGTSFTLETGHAPRVLVRAR